MAIENRIHIGGGKRSDTSCVKVRHPLLKV